jgi:radical SAM superfamily enzyme YgiQ (UPF0313 family)
MEDNPHGALRARLLDFEPEIIGVSFRNIDTTKERDPFNYYRAFVEDIRLINRIRPHAKLIVGGPAFSLFAQTIMERHPEIDFGIYLEGEDAFPQLLANLENPGTVAGILFRMGDHVTSTGQRSPIDFRSFPVPRHDILPVERYRDSFRFQMGVQTKRGCALRCAYCSYPYLEGSAQRNRSPKSVVDEIAHLVDTYNIRDFMFVDGVFNIPQEHAADICSEIIRRGLEIRWWAYFNERPITEEFIALARQAGCDTLSYSPDAYGPRALEMLDKNITRQDIRKAYNLARRMEGIKVGFNFFYNPPGQTLRDLLALLLFYLKAKIRLRRKLRGLSLSSIRIEPHTPLYSMAISQGVITPETDLHTPLYSMAISQGVITPETDLLPIETESLSKLFYANPSTRYMTKTMKLVLAVMRWLRKG